MSTEPDQHSQRDPDSAPVQQQQQQPGRSEGHAGHGADSALKQLRDWERQRALQSGGKHREGPR